MPNQPIKVYYYPLSPPCRAVLLTAKLLGLKVELILINIMEGEQKTPEFLKWPMLAGKEYNEEKAEKLKEVVGWLNSMLEGRKFVAGDKLSIADITTVVTMSNLDSLGFDYSSYPNVKSWFERTVKELEPYGYEEINKNNADKLATMLKKE
ncbi:Glutathione S-transferase D7 [Papilio machaon]|uniref:Glutathione S-transferase D7 n=1 Tax=Papilio machaon TaxID=76193 RepID=A0A194QXR6_PAPMA|nr:Glutathione S-transferase D7 [Papilio machaon]